MDALPPRSSWRVPRPTAAPRPPEIEGLIEEGTDALPVRITIVQNGVRTGWDDGALGFEPDAVWFSGRACSFRIVAPDAISSAYGVSGHEFSHGESSIPLRHPTRRIVVEVAVIAREGHSEWRDSQTVVGSIRRFLRSSTAEGESQYPPLAPRPGILPGDFTLRHALLGVLLVFGLVLGGLSSDRGALLLGVIAGVVVLLAYPDRTRARQLRRIDAEEAALPPSALVPPPSS